jgi:hypothetical protein
MSFRSLELADSATMIAIIKQQFIPAAPGEDCRCSADLAGSLPTLQTAGAEAGCTPTASGLTHFEARENALNNVTEFFPHSQPNSQKGQQDHG